LSPRGLDGLWSVDELAIQRSGFISLTGLDNLHRIGKLDISDNRSLISVNALRSVTHIGELVLERNSRICGKGGLFNHLEGPPARSVIDHNPTLFHGEIANLRSEAGPPIVTTHGIANAR